MTNQISNAMPIKLTCKKRSPNQIDMLKSTCPK